MPETKCSELSDPIWIEEFGFGKEFKVGDKVEFKGFAHDGLTGVIVAVDKDTMDTFHKGAYYTKVKLNEQDRTLHCPTFMFKGFKERKETDERT